MKQMYEINVGILKQWLRQFSIFENKIKIEITSKMWRVKVVDPAHVLLLETELLNDSFIEYSSNESPHVFGIDSSIFYDSIKDSNNDDIVYIEVMDNALEIHNNSKTVLEFFDISLITTPEKIPKITWNSSVGVDTKWFRNAIRHPESDHVAINIDSRGMRVYIECDESHTKDITIHKSRLESHNTDDNYTSKFSMTYLQDILKIIKTKSIEIYLDQDRPIKIRYGHEKSITSEILLAPRLNEDGSDSTIPDIPIEDYTGYLEYESVIGLEEFI